MLVMMERLMTSSGFRDAGRPELPGPPSSHWAIWLVGLNRQTVSYDVEHMIRWAARASSPEWLGVVVVDEER